MALIKKPDIKAKYFEIPKVGFLKMPTLSQIKAIDEPHKLTIYLWDGSIILSSEIDDYEAIENSNPLYKGEGWREDTLVIDMVDGKHQRIKLADIRKLDIEYIKTYQIPI